MLEETTGRVHVHGADMAIRRAKLGGQSFALPHVHTKHDTHVDDGELLQDSTKLLVERVLCELHFAHVEVADTADLEVLVDNLRPTAMSTVTR